jgi:protein TonB
MTPIIRRAASAALLAFLSIGFVGVACATKQAPVADVPDPARGARPGARASIETLVQQLSSSDSKARAAAAWELADKSQLTNEVKATLAAFANDGDREVRYAVYWALNAREEPAATTSYDTAPKPLRITRPEYPQDAFSKKVQGAVIIEILIGEDGEVAHAKIKKPVPGLNEAALACVSHWKFQPATRAGRSLPTIALVPIDFRIF